MTLVVRFRSPRGRGLRIRSWIRLTTYSAFALLRSLYDTFGKIEIEKAVIWRGSPDAADLRPDKYARSLDADQVSHIVERALTKDMFKGCDELIVNSLWRDYRSATARTVAGFLADLCVEVNDIVLDLRLVTYPLPEVSRLAFRYICKARGIRVAPPQIVLDVYTVVPTHDGKVKVESFYDLLEVGHEELVQRIRILIMRYILDYLLNTSIELSTNVGPRTYRLINLLDYVDIAIGPGAYRSLMRAIPTYRRHLVKELIMDFYRDLREIDIEEAEDEAVAKELRDALRIARSSAVVAGLRKIRSNLESFIESLLQHYEIYAIYPKFSSYEEIDDSKLFARKLLEKDKPCLLIPRTSSSPVESHREFTSKMMTILKNMLLRLHSEGIKILQEKLKPKTLGWDTLTSLIAHILHELFRDSCTS